MIDKDFIVSSIVVACLIYLIYICYRDYLKKKETYLKTLTIFLSVEVLRRILIYGKVSSRLIGYISFFQLIFLLISLALYGAFYVKNNLS